MEQYPRGRTCLASQIGTKNNEKSEIKLTKGVSERLISI